MTSTTYVDLVGPAVNAEWLNDVNDATYNGTGVYTPAGTGAVATTVQAALRKIGVGTSPSLTVATLPTPASSYPEWRAFVSDSNTTMTAGIGAVVVGGGANKVPVYCDGTNWRIG